MEQLLEILRQIAQLAGVAVDALEQASGGGGAPAPESGPPEGGGGAPVPPGQ